jgi:light-regulated signal transduction histidine kinase (bacteriophytochrome)
MTALRDESGSLCGFAKITRDLTERRLIEERLLRAHEELEHRVQQRTAQLKEANESLRSEIIQRSHAQASLAAQAKELAESNAKLSRSNRDLDEFAYVASHDLREPLRGIHNYATFLIEDYADKLDAEGRQKLETLQRLSKRMDTLIDALLHFSRVGRTELAVQQTNLQEVLSEVLDSVRIMLEEHRVDVRLPVALPAVVCDRVRVGEIFENLIVNAVKYNDKPHKWVEIGTTTRPRETNAAGDDSASAKQATDARQAKSDELVFYVRDNGIGIPEKHHEGIFRIFKRLHGRDKFGGGTGAGLTIVKKIVERHGGRIWIESTVGEGTTFFFTLPQEIAA